MKSYDFGGDLNLSSNDMLILTVIARSGPTPNPNLVSLISRMGNDGQLVASYLLHRLPADTTPASKMAGYLAEWGHSWSRIRHKPVCL